MSQGIDHPAWNFTFRAPSGEEDRVCDLRVYVTTNFNQTKITSITSCWELTDEEIQEVIRTKRIMMNVLGGGLSAHFIAPESVMRQFVTDYGKTW